MVTENSTPRRTYKMSELIALSGINERSIRHYINIGMVERALTRGAGAVYGQQTLDKLVAINKLKQVFIHQLDRRLSLKEIDYALQSSKFSNRWHEVLGADESAIARNWGEQLAGLINEPVAPYPQPENSGDLAACIRQAAVFMGGGEFMELPGGIHKRVSVGHVEINIHVPDDLEARTDLAEQARQLAALFAQQEAEEPEQA